MVAVTDTIAIIFGLATVVLGVIAIVITYNQRTGRTNDRDVENIPLGPVPPHQNAAQEALGDLFESVAKVLYTNRRVAHQD